MFVIVKAWIERGLFYEEVSTKLGLDGRFPRE